MREGHITGVWFEISYNLRMLTNEGEAECGGSPWLRMGGGERFINLTARETIPLNISLSFARYKSPRLHTIMNL